MKINREMLYNYGVTDDIISLIFGCSIYDDVIITPLMYLMLFCPCSAQFISFSEKEFVYRHPKCALSALLCYLCTAMFHQSVPIPDTIHTALFIYH